ncbi:thrombospondin type 3 repeat-containing protein [Candidatus Peregrinibacteria bacterium]|nr:thrombospondin type 3 repeat-containing protein [Candidatus Peregrinibacteria bacterium]
MKNYFKNRQGTTFIELLLYIAVFLVLTPVLLAVSINAIRFDKQHQGELQANIDSQFVVERMYDLIAGAKKIDTANSVLGNSEGKLTLIMPDDSVVVIEANLADQAVDITEGGVKSSLSSDDLRLESLYFDRITDSMNDPEIILGATAHMTVTGTEQYSAPQEYVMSANLENGDFDEDGCPDYKDKYPRHPECCGDGDMDGICDEMDNCVLVYNPFQEDYEGDGIGDECDGDIFFEGPGSEPELPAGEDEDDDDVDNELDNCPDVENPDQLDTDGDGIGDACDLDEDEGGGAEGTGGGLGAFTCITQDDLIALINHVPPIPNGILKNILMGATPLAPAVLDAIIERDPAMTAGHIQQIFTANVLLYDEQYDAVMDLGLPPGIAELIEDAQEEATEYAWQGEGPQMVTYQVEVSEDGDWIRFYDADIPLGTDGRKNTDVFIVTATDGTESVDVTLESGGDSHTYALSGPGDSYVSPLGFAVVLENISGNNYGFTVSSYTNLNPLTSVMFDFGNGDKGITAPTPPTYTTSRYTYYCPGGCSDDCGDVGTGIVTGDIFTDVCYRAADGSLPEWCSRWKTFLDDNSTNPAYMGGTQEGEEDLYWEKSFKSLLSADQVDQLESITVGGEIAYQSITQFFCDTLAASCPMNGALIGSQEVELYNWDTASWEIIGALELDGDTSDQQKFEVKYDGADPQKFFGGLQNRIIKARMQFNWDGVPPVGETSAPSFMVIDYFTVHLKW